MEKEIAVVLLIIQIKIDIFLELSVQVSLADLGQCARF
jgi:hypothetical protein